MWGELVEPIASQVPYMVAIGNHEEVNYKKNIFKGNYVKHSQRFNFPVLQCHVLYAPVLHARL